MSSSYPPWLAGALPATAAGTAPLTVARLANEKALGRGGFTLTSPAFDNGGELDPCFTADEEDSVAPPLEWSSPPQGATELVLVVEDATSSGSDAACHWLVWGLPAQKGKLLEGEVPPRVGKNAHGNSEWLLPAPLQADDAHSYVFQIFAVDLPLTLMPGADRADVLAAIDGHIVAAAVLTGTYKRVEEEDAWEEDEEFE